MNKSNSKETKNNKQKRIRTIKRLIFDLCAFLALIIAGTALLYNSLLFQSDKVTNVTEKGNIDYKVYLLKNDFYENDYLEKDMLYVASLIDKIVIDFNYNLESTNKESIDFTYSIIAKLSINNTTGTKSYYEKVYTLLDNKKVSMNEGIAENISERISLDYPHYNNLANSFKSQYGIESDSKLTVYMIVNKKNGENTNFQMDSSSVMNIEIPLSERSVDIRFDDREINNASTIVEKQSMSTKDIVSLVISVLFILLSLIMMIKAMRNIKALSKNKNAFDKYVSKILKEYDRLIAESSTLLSFEGKEVANINKFTELLDIHDNLQKPIMYYLVEPHEQCYFYISHENVIYLLDLNLESVENKK